MTVDCLLPVDWPGVAAGLEQDPRTGPAADWHAARASPLLGPARTRLAVHATLQDAGQVAALVTQHGGDQEISRWLCRASRAAFRITANASPDVTRLTVMGAPQPVHVSMRLRALPCLGLAAEHAAQHRPIVVRAVGLPPGVDGRTWNQAQPCTFLAYGRVHQVAAVTVVDIDPAAGSPAAVWAHELAHVLNPSTAGRTAEADEDQADALAQLLLRHRPTTVADLHGLLASTGAGASPVTTPAPAPILRIPAPGLESLLVLASLNIT